MSHLCLTKSSRSLLFFSVEIIGGRYQAPSMPALSRLTTPSREERLCTFVLLVRVSLQNCGAQPLFEGNAECTAFYAYKPVLRSLNHLFLKRHSYFVLDFHEGFYRRLKCRWTCESGFDRVLGTHGIL